MKSLNILIVGVGGQGTLLTSKVLGCLAGLIGQDVKVSELHGMAQRGGSVVTHVRFGDRVAAPLIDEGQADVILAFEKLEALRYSNFLRPGGKIIVNDLQIWPMPVILGNAEYPADVLEQLQAICDDVTCVDATSMAAKAGSSKALNTVMLGILAKTMDVPAEKWEQALEQTVPERFVALNRKAFELGLNA